MGCFVVPAAEAVATSVATKVIEKKEGAEAAVATKERFSAKLKRLNGFLWGGAGLLAFEHLWHGEVQPFFPFLTAAANPADTAEMLHEMSTVGVSMAVLMTLIWFATSVVGSKIASRAE